MRLFEKKFKVRVRHFAAGGYMVQYTWHRFIPWWRTLLFWFDQGYPGGAEGWEIRLWDFKNAERIAMGLKSIIDVEAYYKPEKEFAGYWRIKKSQYLKDNVPYKKKKIA